jgi:phytoene dehydrogenase-like protein
VVVDFPRKKIRATLASFTNTRVHLKLEKRGAVYLEPELNAALIRRSGEALEWWTDFEKTAGSFGRFSLKDEATLRRWRNDFLPIVEHISPRSRYGSFSHMKAACLPGGACEGLNCVGVAPHITVGGIVPSS